jgi:hypothetical protein
MNRCYIDDVTKMKAEFEKSGLDKFVRKYKQYECLIGDSDAVRFVEAKIDEWCLLKVNS